MDVVARNTPAVAVDIAYLLADRSSPAAAAAGADHSIRLLPVGMGFPHSTLALEIVADHSEDRRGRAIAESWEGNMVPHLGALREGMWEGRPIGRQLAQ